VLRVQAGVGNGSEVRGSRRWLGKVVAHAEEGSRGGEQGRGRGRGTRGSYPSRRWSGGGSTMAAARCSAPAAGGQSKVARARGRRREGMGLGGLFGNLRNLRDLSVK
jgi:hypothetical protein